MMAFILTRAFAICALLIGAASISYAAPIAEKRDPMFGLCGRGCLFADPEATASVVPSVIPTAAAIPSSIPKIIEIIELVSPAQPTAAAVPQEPALNLASPISLSVVAAATPSVATVKVIEITVPSTDSSPEDISSPVKDFLEAIPDLVAREREVQLELDV